MENKDKYRYSLISNISIGKKILFIDGMVVLALLIIAFAMFRTVSASQNDKYSQMEKTALTSAEQIMNMSVDNAVAVAKNIYMNEAIYDFLNTKYDSSSAYYEAYYPLQQNTAMSIADTNLVNKCSIYTANDTVLEGGSIFRLYSARNEFWYLYFQKMNKSTVLCIEPSSNKLVMIRKLDYQHLATGESYLRLEMNSDALSEFVDNLGFEGELYVMSGGDLLYSSDSDVTSVDDINISPDFECITRNYYTFDVEFYSCASKKGALSTILDNKQLVISFAAVLLIVTLASLTVYFNVRRRIGQAVKVFRESGNMDAIRKGCNGSDEIGQLLDICREMSDGMMRKGKESRISSDFLQQKSSDYEALFTTAMRLDAELAIENRLPELKLETEDEEILLSDEAELLQKTADKYGVSLTSEAEMPPEWKIPAYSLVLIGEDIFTHYGSCSAKIVSAENGIRLEFNCEKTARSTDTLKFSAIFEEGGIAEEYSFDRSYRFNPYFRLKHCLGSSVDAEVKNKKNFFIALTLKYPKV